MKKTSLRLVTMVLILSMGLLFSCSQTPSATESNTEAQGTETNESSLIEDETISTPELDLPPVDMNGKTFTILTTGWCGHKPLDTVDIVAEELTGEAMNDAVYNRILYLESKYNVTVEQMNYPDYNDASNRISRSVMADDPIYDLCLIRSTNFTTLITNKYLVDLNEIPSLALSQPWWDSNSRNSLSLFGKNYGVCSDITVNDDLAVWCVYFNKNMIQDYDLESPYNLVKNNQWDYNKLFEMGKTVTHDLNGDGVMNKNDVFGVHHSNDTTVGMLNCIGVNFGEIGNDGAPVFTLGNEANITKMLALFTPLFDLSNVYNFHARGEGVGEVDMFAKGQVLFNFSAIHMAETLRAMEQDFGILPYPKLDETQNTYMSSISPLFLTLAVVPTTNTDLENTGILMEEMAYQGYKNIRPAFYDLLLQGKVARDNESLEMLDYIFSNIVYDVGGLLNIGNFSWDFTVNIPNKYDMNVVSYIESHQDKIQSSIDKIVEALN